MLHNVAMRCGRFKDSLSWKKYLSLRVPLQGGKRRFHKIYSRSLGEAQSKARYYSLARVKGVQAFFLAQIFLRHIAAIPVCRSKQGRHIRTIQVDKLRISTHPNFHTVLPRDATMVSLSLLSCAALEVLYFRRSLAPKWNAAMPAKANIINSSELTRHKCYGVADICVVE